MTPEEEKVYEMLINKYPSDKEDICQLVNEGYNIYLIFSTLTSRHYNMKVVYCWLEKSGITGFDTDGNFLGLDGPEDGRALIQCVLKYFEEREEYHKCAVLKHVLDEYNIVFHKAALEIQ